MNFFLLLFIVVPIVEMMILIEVGSFIGAFYTILLVLMTAMIGVSLLKKQGLSTLLRANQKMSGGQMPVSEIGEGMMLAVAGALLLTPGFVTDSIGFVLLTPGLRQKIASYIGKRVIASSGGNGSGFSQFHYQSDIRSNMHDSMRTRPGPGSRSSDADVIDGEFEELSEQKIEINIKKDQ